MQTVKHISAYRLIDLDAHVVVRDKRERAVHAYYGFRSFFTQKFVFPSIKMLLVRSVLFPGAKYRCELYISITSTLEKSSSRFS